jgi:hypothetical protein
MALDLLDRRLISVLDKNKYLRLKTELNQTYEKICQEATSELMDDVSQLLQLKQEIENDLLENRTATLSTDWAQGSMATLG